MTTPIVFQRRVMEVVREASYGRDPGTAGVFPVFFQGDEVPVWRTSQFDRSPSTRHFGAGQTRYADQYGEFAPIRSFLMDGHEGWLALLEASGFRRVSDVQWAAVPAAEFTSLTVRHHMGGIKQIITGARASLAFRALAGGPISVDANIAGRMVEERGTAPRSVLDLPTFSRLCNAQCSFTIEDVGPYIPKGLEEIEITTGTVLTTKAMSSAAGRLVWRVQNTVPSFRCRIESDADTRWMAKKGKRVGVRITLGGWRWDFPVMGAAGVPEDVRLSSGLAGVGLVLRTIADRSRPVTVTKV